MGILTSTRCELGESPRWDDRNCVVRWIDINSGRVLSAGLTDTLAQEHVVGAPCGALVLGADGDVLVAVGGRWASSLTGADRARITTWDPSMRFNDAGVDSRGRIWSATMRVDEDLDAPASGELFRVDVNGVTSVCAGIFAGNGIGWSPDESRMYLVDSGRNEILCADFDSTVGTVGEFHHWASPVAGLADGLAVDAEGGVWLAQWGAGTVVRFDRFARPTHTISLPTPHVTAVTFVGDNLDLLAVTTAAVGRPSSDAVAGALFIGEAPLPGFLTHRAELRLGYSTPMTA